MFDFFTGDHFSYIAAILTTIAFIPQAVQTIITRDTDAISLEMYICFCTGVFFWLCYGVHIGSWAMMIANSFTLVLSLIILSYKIFNERKKA